MTALLSFAEIEFAALCSMRTPEHVMAHVCYVSAKMFAACILMSTGVTRLETGAACDVWITRQLSRMPA